MKYYMATADILVLPGVSAWLEKADSEMEAWSKAYGFTLRSKVLDSGSVDVVEVPEGTQLYRTVLPNAISEVVTLDVIKHRYYVGHESYKGFDDYVARGFVDEFGQVDYVKCED